MRPQLPRGSDRRVRTSTGLDSGDSWAFDNNPFVGTRQLAGLNRVTDRQWRDAFRAGGFEASLARRYVARIKARAAEGLAMTLTTSPSPGL